MKYFPLASLLSLLLVMPACNWNWRGRCVRPCGQPCATSCTAPCATSCTSTCANAEVVTEVPVTYSAPIVPTQDGQIYTQRPEAYQEQAYQAYQMPADQDIDLDRSASKPASYYDTSDMK